MDGKTRFSLRTWCIYIRCGRERTFIHPKLIYNRGRDVTTHSAGIEGEIDGAAAIFGALPFYPSSSSSSRRTVASSPPFARLITTVIIDRQSSIFARPLVRPSVRPSLSPHGRFRGRERSYTRVGRGGGGKSAREIRATVDVMQDL